MGLYAPKLDDNRLANAHTATTGWLVVNVAIHHDSCAGFHIDLHNMSSLINIPEVTTTYRTGLRQIDDKGNAVPRNASLIISVPSEGGGKNLIIFVTGVPMKVNVPGGWID